MSAAPTVAFDEPEQSNAEVQLFGLGYSHRPTPDGDLWLCDYARPWVAHLQSSQWYHAAGLAQAHARLGFSTGCVYRVSTDIGGRRYCFVAKRSRVGQRIEASGLTFREREPPSSFTSPFEELGRLEALRRRSGWPQKLFSKRPLGVFSPAERFPSWMFDRVPYEFKRAATQLELQQSQVSSRQRIRLEPDRDYITLFSWIRGHNLEELVQANVISPSELVALDEEARGRLADIGCNVADHKPNHVIVRLDSRGVPRRRHGQLVFAIADYELLEAPGVGNEKTIQPQPCALRSQGCIDASDWRESGTIDLFE